MSSYPSPLTEAFAEGLEDPKALANKYVKLADRQHTVAEQVVLDDMGAMAPHGMKPAAVVVQKERPEHTFMAFKFAQGQTSKEVYLSYGGEWDSETGLPISGTGSWSYQAILNLRRQPWFVKRITGLLMEAGLDQITAALKAELPNAIDVARDVMNDPNEKGSTKLQAASFFFDRALGKATQHIRTEHVKSVDDYEKTAQQLQEEIETIEAEIVSINPSQK